MEEDLNGRQPQWKTTSREDNLKEDNLRGRTPQCHGKNTSMEEYLNGSRPQLKPYKKMTLARGNTWGLSLKTPNGHGVF